MPQQTSFPKELCINYDIPYEYMDRVIKEAKQAAIKDFILRFKDDDIYTGKVIKHELKGLRL